MAELTISRAITRKTAIKRKSHSVADTRKIKPANTTKIAETKCLRILRSSLKAVIIPSVQEFENRINKTLETYPYLVAEEDGQVLGYAYASTYYARTAYNWTTELSIYLHEDARGRGLGSQLYDALEEELEQRGFLRFLACIAVPNEASIAMHEKRGYVQVAHFPKVGYKFEQWHDIVWMQKTLDGPVRKIR